MSWVSGDRVKETTTTTGTGDVTLAGAASGFRAFSAICADGDQVDYVIAGGAEWEAGLGTWHTGNTLTRTRVRASSNAGALVTFSAGSKDIWNDFPAAHGLDAPQSREQTIDRYLPPNTSLIVSQSYEIVAGKTLEVGLGAVLEIT